MSFSKPTPPDPSLTANAQQQYNTMAATSQNKINSYDQNTPYGSLSYAQDPNSPSGYDVNTQLSPAQQQLLNLQQGAQTSLGGTAQNLAGNVAGMYSQAPNIDPSTVTKQLQGWQQQYVQPLFNQQQSNLDASLANQGLTPGSTAYNNAQNLLARNQGDVTNQFFAQDEPLAFNQAVQQYQLPLQTLQGLMGDAAPTGPSFQQTPNSQVQPANFSGLAQQNYQNQNQQYMAGLQGAFGIPTALAGGWARGGFSGLSNPFNSANPNNLTGIYTGDPTVPGWG